VSVARGTADTTTRGWIRSGRTGAAQGGWAIARVVDAPRISAPVARPRAPGLPPRVRLRFRPNRVRQASERNYLSRRASEPHGTVPEGERKPDVRLLTDDSPYFEPQNLQSACHSRLPSPERAGHCVCRRPIVIRLSNTSAVFARANLTTPRADDGVVHETRVMIDRSCWSTNRCRGGQDPDLPGDFRTSQGAVRAQALVRGEDQNCTADQMLSHRHRDPPRTLRTTEVKSRFVQPAARQMANPPMVTFSG
jgi:hypothetical protein